MFARGDKIKGYEIIAPLRSGGMAMLYLARRRGVGGFSRLVALKLVHSHLQIDAGINRLFLREARIAASIAHPNVVNVEEVGEAEGNYFIAMEYVHGVSLAELLNSLQKRRLRMSSKLSVWIAAHVAEALQAAHEAKSESGLPLHIVHRDVSPQNVLIGHTGHVKLIDFGIAKSPGLSRHMTSAGAVLGKLGYMAPEQLRGDPVDRRTDVYALGVMLWEMLTSRSLFRALHLGDEQDWATRQNPPPPMQYSPLVSPALDRVVNRALAFEAQERYASAIEFRTQLLQAEPAAAEVDAPRLAELMRSLLAEELERQRAGWPRDVNAELGVDTRLPTRAVNIEELTSNLKVAEVLDDDGMGAEEPTTVMESSAQRLRRIVESGFDAARLETPLPSCAIPTPSLGAPALGLAPAGVLARRQMFRAIALSVLCVSFGALPADSAREASARSLPELGTLAPSSPAERTAAFAARVRSHALLAGGEDSPGGTMLCGPAEDAQAVRAATHASVESEIISFGAPAAVAASAEECACHEGASKAPQPPAAGLGSQLPTTGHGRGRRSHHRAE